MPNSADNSLDIDPSLHEDSDVIELTEEVEEARKQAQKQAANSEHDFPDLFSDDLSMPEFRMPAERSALASTDPKGVPQAAIFGRKTRPRQHTPALETLKLSLDEIDGSFDEEIHVPEGASLDGESSSTMDEGVVPPSAMPSSQPSEATTAELGALEESSIISLDSEVEVDTSQHMGFGAERPEVDTVQLPSLDRETGEIATPKNPEPQAPPVEEEATQEPAFDRQELVRTIQMEAVNREEIELSIDLERLHHANALQDQRFAPDVINRPPRILNRKWVEGLENIFPQDASSPQPPPRPAEPATPAQPVAAAQRPEQIPAASPSPSYQATPPQQARPPQQQQPQQSPAVARQSQVTPRAQVAQQPAPQPAPSVQKEQDPELKGLVQELIEEGSAPPQQKKPAQNKQQAKVSRQQALRDGWFKDVFSEEFLRTIPRDVERVTERESLFIQDSLSLQHGSRILDLACGFGRHAIALTQRKLEIVGLDLSMALLQRALQDAQRRNLSIKFVHGDMRSMNFNEIFDGCYLWQSSFGYFDDVTNFKVLKDIARALKPGGRFLIDVMNRDYVIADMPSRCWWEGRDCIFLEEVDFDYSRSILHTKRSFIYEDGSPPLEQNSFVRLYGMHEMMQLLKNAGFRLIEVSGGLSMRGRFLGTNSDRMIFLLEKAISPKQQQPQPRR